MFKIYWITGKQSQANRVSIAVENDNTGIIEVLGSSMEPRAAAQMYKETANYADRLGYAIEPLKFVSPDEFTWICISARFWYDFVD